ncbi:RluA family pseudouridine synthase [Candidatus Fermentibacteria bacterium]|nr:RluA family pseudouridine synthase [Candidatus Fermentibacteria bacterium]
MTGIVWWDGTRMSTLPVHEAAADLLVLYEDNHLLAVFKPAGLLSQGPGHGHNTTLDVAKAWIRRRHDKPGGVYVGLVHRLDRPVGGVLVLAKTSKAAARLSEQFRTGAVRKTYQAVVEGRVAGFGTLSDSVTRRTQHRASRVVPSGRGRHAELDYQVVESGTRASLLEIHPHTGRTHQIRLQLAHWGHPIVGDVKYGSRLRLFGTVALLAKEIRIHHPTRDVEMDIHAPTPPDWPWPLPPAATAERHPR